MTRSHRAIRLPHACVLITLFMLSPQAASPAQAGVVNFLAGFVKPYVTDANGFDASNPGDSVPASSGTGTESDGASDAALGEIQAPAGPPDSVADAAPQVKRGARRISCVPYARQRSGLQIFGDAKYWWNRAKDLYARVTQPATDAVMVFSDSKRIRRGHVAVVTAVVSPREVKVDHANWQNHGEIDLNMPVLDVSKNNNWSEVRVWDPQTGQFGARIYAISGFITRAAPTTRGS